MNYYRPQKLADALNWLADNEAGIAAGCTDLFASTQSQYLQKSGHENLLDITAIDELGEITRTSQGIRIGAGVHWSEVISADLPPSFDGLKAAAHEVGSVQIQNSGTVGGNLCNASPAADGVPPLAILDASVELVSKDGRRTLPLLDFLLGPRKTALNPDEILTSITVPNASAKGNSSFLKLGARKYLVISIAMVAARLEAKDNRIEKVAVCVGSCSAVAVRLPAIEAALTGKPLDINLRDVISPQLINATISPISDIRSDTEYRTRAARELVIRSIGELTGAGITS